MKSLLAEQITPGPTRSNFVRNYRYVSFSQSGSTVSGKQQEQLTDQAQNEMILPVANHITIADLQRKFQENYPYLNLRFVKDFLHSDQPSTIKRLCNPSNTLGREVKLRKEGEFTITDTITVAELIKEFYNTYGVNVQVCRRSGNIWIEITLTSTWSLAQQNSHGRETSI